MGNAAALRHYCKCSVLWFSPVEFSTAVRLGPAGSVDWEIDRFGIVLNVLVNVDGLGQGLFGVLVKILSLQ